MNTKEKLMQLLELCIEKGLSFEMMHENKLQVYDWKGGYLFNESIALFYHDKTNEKVILDGIESLIFKVKNYKS